MVIASDSIIQLPKGIEGLRYLCPLWTLIEKCRSETYLPCCITELN